MGLYDKKWLCLLKSCLSAASRGFSQQLPPVCARAPVSRGDRDLAALGEETGQAGYPMWVGQDNLLYYFLHDSNKLKVW